MPKQKSSKTIGKRFKVTHTGKLLKKRVCISHLNRKETTSSKFRKKRLSQVSKTLSKKFKKVI